MSRPFKCGHPRTPDNCKPNGPGKVTCRICRRVRDRARLGVTLARQAREHNRHTRYRRNLLSRIESKRRQIEQLEQELSNAQEI